VRIIPSQITGRRIERALSARAGPAGDVRNRIDEAVVHRHHALDVADPPD
jgi:hypothetical protein